MGKLVYGVGVYDRDGKYPRLVDGELSKAYKTWQHMLERCYSKKLSVSDSRRYRDRGVVVCDEWHEFSNYADWFYNESNHQIGFHLDKDLFGFRKPLVYAPETCVFLPAEINTFFTTAHSLRGDYPVGVHRRDNNKYKAQSQAITSVGERKQISLGVFDTPEEAFAAYSDYKVNRLRELVDEHMSAGNISMETRNQLYAWKPEPFPE